MSWETIQYEIDCYCGKGKITVFDSSDDWNRSKREEVIQCPICLAKEKEKEEALRLRNEKYKTLQEAIIKHFTNNYLDMWIDFFAICNSKKDLWSKLNELKLESCFIGTFYSRNRNLIKSEILKKYINIDNIKELISILKINDEEFIGKVDDIYIIHIEMRNESIRYYHKGY